LWHPLVWEQRKVSEGSHLVREVVEERRSLDVQVSEHGIGTPATEELNAFFVNASAEEGHCTTGPEASGLNVGGGEAQGLGAEEIDGCSQSVGDILAAYEFVLRFNPDVSFFVFPGRL
jgi:hypothetical protein